MERSIEKMKYINVYIKPSNTLVTGKNLYDSVEDALKFKNPPIGTRFLEVAEVRAGEVSKCLYHCNGDFEGVAHLIKTPHRGDNVEINDSIYRVEKVLITDERVTLTLELVKSIMTNSYYHVLAKTEQGEKHAFPTSVYPGVNYEYFFNGVKYKVVSSSEVGESNFEVKVKRLN